MFLFSGSLRINVIFLFFLLGMDTVERGQRNPDSGPLCVYNV